MKEFWDGLKEWWEDLKDWMGEHDQALITFGVPIIEGIVAAIITISIIEKIRK